MTSTPVGAPLKSDSLITYVGKSSANAMGNTQASFGAAFEKASNEHLGNAKQTTKENPSNPEVAKSSDTTKVEETAKVSPEKDAKITEKDEPMETEAKGALEIKEISPEKFNDSVKEAGEQLIEEIANTFEVDTKDVLEAMENLGLSFQAILQPEGLTSLVLAVSGEDQMALVSEEGLLSNLNSLTEMADEMVANLSNEFDVTKDAMQEILKLMDTTTVAPGTIMEIGIGEEIIFENVGPMNENELGAIKEEMATPVEEEELEDENEVYGVNNHVSETIKDPLVRMAVPTDKNESKEGRSFEQNSSEAFGKNIETLAINQDSPKEGITGIDALFTDVNAQNNPELTATEQASVSYTQDAQTSEIMDQITEYMRVMVKAESTTMEMQLHPASLGSVNVSLTSKDGLLTAQFTAQNTLVKEVIESQMAALRENFEAQGIKVEAVEVTVASHAFERNLDGNNENRDNNSSDTKAKTGRTRKLRLEDLEDAEEELSEEDKLAADMMKQNGNTVDFTA